MSSIYCIWRIDYISTGSTRVRKIQYIGYTASKKRAGKIAKSLLDNADTYTCNGEKYPKYGYDEVREIK